MCGLRINFFFLPVSSIASGDNYCHKHSKIVCVCLSKRVYLCVVCMCGLWSKERVRVCDKPCSPVIFAAGLRCAFV